jgi:hypothetical protein
VYNQVKPLLANGISFFILVISSFVRLPKYHSTFVFFSNPTSPHKSGLLKRYLMAVFYTTKNAKANLYKRDLNTVQTRLNISHAMLGERSSVSVEPFQSK